MWQVVVGVVLTALLGGLLVPVIKERLDRRTERFQSSVELIDGLAGSLWTYWKYALRVAYYGKQGRRGAEDFAQALRRWDSNDSWQVGCDIQIQVSRSKRLLPNSAHGVLDDAQRNVVDFLDTQIDDLRRGGTPEQWKTLYATLMDEKRREIDSLVQGVMQDMSLLPSRR